MIKSIGICLMAWFATLMFGFSVSAQERRGGEGAESTPVIVFVCEHGAAKSIVAAAHFNRLAREQRLNIRAVARGTNPDEKIAPSAAEGLKADGLTSGESAPKKISPADLVGARRVIAFCPLPDEDTGGVKTEHWDGVPPMSEDYNKARDWLVERIGRLLEELRSEKLPLR